MAMTATGTKRTKAAKPSDFKALILRTCDSDMRSYGGFLWPTAGEVVAPDWRATKECGHGLHGFLWGEGDGGLASFAENAKWIVAGINDWIDLSGKVKFERAVVLHVGDRLSATAFIQKHGAKGAIVGGTATAGDGGTATAGYRGTATAGDGGTATAGDGGTATAGVGGTATAGDRGTVLIRFYDYKAERYRIITGYVGEDGIKPNAKYRVIDGKLAEAL